MIIKNIKWLLCLMMLPLFAACGWEDLPAYEDANITGIQFYYRWASTTDKDPITGEPMVREQRLNITGGDIDDETGTVVVDVAVPAANSGNFTQAVRDQVSQSNIVCQVTLSTAARIAPVDGGKVLGVPDDWTKPHKFIVTAADGTKKEWTITVTSFTK